MVRGDEHLHQGGKAQDGGLSMSRMEVHGRGRKRCLGSKQEE